MDWTGTLKLNAQGHFGARVALVVLVVLAAVVPQGARAQETGPIAQLGYAGVNGGTSGGLGGPVVRVSTGTGIHEALCSRVASDSPLVIEVEGTIAHGNTEGVSGLSCNAGGGDERIELKDVSNVSIVGVGGGALFDQLGIHIRSSSNIVLRNLHVRNVKKSGSPVSNGGDAIGMESDVHNVWVDHCTLEASGGESAGYDGLFDMKAGTQYVTLSYSVLLNSGRGGLVGSSDSDDDNGPVTYHHNVFQNLDSRTPLLRHGTAHAFNNHYTGITKSGMNPRIGGRIKVENNYFERARDPLGTFYTNEMGAWEVSGNVFASTVTWSRAGDKNHPAGPKPTSTTTIDIPYAYTLDGASCVPDLLQATAGANRGLLGSSGQCTPIGPEIAGPESKPKSYGSADAGSRPSNPAQDGDAGTGAEGGADAGGPGLPVAGGDAGGAEEVQRTGGGLGANRGGSGGSEMTPEPLASGGCACTVRSRAPSQGPQPMLGLVCVIAVLGLSRMGRSRVCGNALRRREPTA